VREEGAFPSDLIVGENFEVSDSQPDGCYVLGANGVDFLGQDVTISTSFLYQLRRQSHDIRSRPRESHFRSIN